jgi:hypothetical protein
VSVSRNTRLRAKYIYFQPGVTLQCTTLPGSFSWEIVHCTYPLVQEPTIPRSQPYQMPHRRPLQRPDYTDKVPHRAITRASLFHPPMYATLRDLHMLFSVSHTGATMSRPILLPLLQPPRNLHCYLCEIHNDKKKRISTTDIDFYIRAISSAHMWYRCTVPYTIPEGCTCGTCSMRRTLFGVTAL